MNTKKTKIGLIEFTNCLPLNYSFERQNHPDFEFIYGTPAELNRLIARKEIAAAAISSFEYLQNKDKYSLITKACISSDGECGSVLVFSERKLENLSDCRVGIPCDSASSVALLKIILNELNINNIEFVEHRYEKTPQEYIEEGFDAVLFIGDNALRSGSKEKLKRRRADGGDENFSKLVHLNIYDIGTLWKELTGMPTVFGTWAARTEWANNNPELFEKLNNLIPQAIETGLGIYFNEVVNEASCKIGIETDIISEYLTKKIRYIFTSEHEKSLQAFEKLYGKLEKPKSCI